MMGGFRIPGPLGSEFNSLKIDDGTTILTVTPPPGVTGSSSAIPVTSADGDPPVGLLRSKRNWKTLLSSQIDDIITREGKFGDGTWMNTPALKGLRTLYKQNWRESIVRGGVNSEIAAYWAMHHERICELLALFDSARGRAVREMEAITKDSSLDDRTKFKKLAECDRNYMAQLHLDAVDVDKKTNGEGNVRTDEEEDLIVSKARAERVRLQNGLTKVEISNLRQKVAMVAQSGAAGDFQARKEQKRRLREMIFGPASGDPKAMPVPDDGLPHYFQQVVALRLGMERQEQLLGGSLLPDDARDALMKEMDANLTTAVTEVKKGMVLDARLSIDDAKRRLASVAGIADPKRKADEERFALEELSGIVSDMLGGERQRQLLGSGDDNQSGAGGGGDASILGKIAGRTSEDGDLDKLSQDAERLYREYARGKPAMELGIARQDQLLGRDADAQ